MKLLRVVDELQRLRKERADAKAAEKSRIAIVWSHCEKRLDDVALREGEFLALDLTLTDLVGDMETWRTVERVTRDPDDYGRVFDARGLLAGKVASIKNGLVTLELSAAARAEQRGALEHERSQEAQK